MSKAYPSNLTLAQFDYLNDLIPEAKSGGHPRSVEMWKVLNVVFHILVEGVRWRALPGTFPPGRRCTPISATGVTMAPGCRSMTVYAIGCDRCTTPSSSV